MIYLYAITDRPETPLPDLAGLEDAAEPESYRLRDIAAVISHTNTTAPPPVDANLWQHEKVLEALMAVRTILPVRFGTMLADEAALGNALEDHYADFTAGLKRVRGQVELSLRVLWEEDGGHREPRPSQSQEMRGAGTSGRDYMLARLEAERQLQSTRQEAERLANELHKPLAGLSFENRSQILPTPHLLLKAAYLVEAGRVSAFRQAVGELSAAHPAQRFLCTGPWPPYNFVTI